MSKNKLSRRTFLTASSMAALAVALDWNKIEAHASRMGPKSEYPTVVIGAGLGGLCSAAYLAQQGIPVTVLEQQNRAGGYATSFTRAQGKYKFEVSLQSASIHNNNAARILKNLNILQDINLTPLPEFYQLKNPHIEDLSVPQKNPQEYINRLVQLFPGDKEAIQNIVQEMIGIAVETEKLQRKKGKIVKFLFPFQYPKMWKIRNKNLAEFMEEYVTNSYLKDILASLWGYYGLPPSKLSAYYYASATGNYLKNGAYYIKPRSEALSQALAQSITRAGGRIYYNSQVTEILVQDSAVKGVRTAQGKTFPARGVVSNASAPNTLRTLLPPKSLTQEYLNKLEAYNPSLSTFIVWLGLNQDIAEEFTSCAIHVPSGEGVEQDYKYCLAGNIEKGPFSLTLYDKIFPGYSQPGTSTLKLVFLTDFEPWRPFEQDYKNGIKKAYKEQKAKWTEVLIKRAEENIFPGLSAMIEVKDSATPLTNWRYTRNPQGAIYGYNQTLQNTFMNRLGNKTPIKGLFLASAWSEPGGGYSGVLRSGELCFEKLMHYWGA